MRPPATSSRMSRPLAGTSSWRIAPPRRNQRRSRTASRTASSSRSLAAAEDVDSPTAVARLDDERRPEPQWSSAVREVHGLRMRQAGRGEGARRAQLVVGPHECGAGVQHTGAGPGHVVEQVDAVFDAVERGEDVQSADRDVARPEQGLRLGRREKRRRDTALPPGGDQVEIRLLLRPDDRDDRSPGRAVASDLWWFQNCDAHAPMVACTARRRIRIASDRRCGQVRRPRKSVAPIGGAALPS